MLTKILTRSFELFLWTLLFGITCSNSITEIGMAGVVVVFLVRRAIAHAYWPPRTPLNVGIYIFWAVVLITFFRSAYFSESIRGFAKIIKYGLVYFACVDFFVEDRKRIQRFFWAFIAVTLITSVNGIFQYIAGFDFLRHRLVDQLDNLHRIGSSFEHPNDFASYLISVIPLTFTFFSPRMPRWQRGVLIVVCLLASFCLLKTSSRAAWLGFFTGMTIYFFYYKKKIAIVVPVVILLVIIASPHGLSRITSLFAVEQNTVWERMKLWEGTWNMVQEHPVFGFGVNTFSRYFPAYKPHDYPDIRYTHNSYLQMWSEIGIVGLLAFLSIVATAIVTTLRRLRQKVGQGLDGFIVLGALAGYVAFLIQAAFDTNFSSLPLTTYFWVMTAFLMSLDRLLDDR